MKALFRLVVFLGVVAVVAWVMRARQLPAPEPPLSQPPAFRRPHAPASAIPSQPPPTSSPAIHAVDDLTEVKGIGPVYARRLNEIGINSFSQLAAADAASTAERIDTTPTQVADWIGQAAVLAR